jgi:hypothetical protein
MLNEVINLISPVENTNQMMGQMQNSAYTKDRVILGRRKHSPANWQEKNTCINKIVIQKVEALFYDTLFFPSPLHLKII